VPLTCAISSNAGDQSVALFPFSILTSVIQNSCAVVVESPIITLKPTPFAGTS
jgi:hypothetical protein